VLSVIYLLLVTGIHIKSIKTSSLSINELYIKWDEKLNVHIQKLDFLQDDTDKSFVLKHKDIPNHLLIANILGSFIKSFVIDEINYKDTNATLRYTDNKLGYFGIKSKEIIVDIDIKPENNFISFNIKKFELKNKKVNLISTIVLDTKKHELYLSAKTEIGSDVSLNINISTSVDELKYAISSNKNIKSIKYLISLLKPNKTLNYWINEAIEMKYLTLKSAYGWIDFKNPDTALKNLYVYLNGNEFKYTYHPKLDAIHTKNTDLVFKDGVLFIVPNDSTTYEFELDSSWLKIDFNDTEEKLALYLQFDGMVDKHLLYLLNVYNIKLPFIQNSGYMDTDLKLDINLRSLDVDANGYFYTDKANFTYLGLDLDLRDTLVYLNNLDVKIKKMTASYKDIAKTKVLAELDLKNDTGFIDFNISKISVSKTLKLNTNKKNLFVKYIIKPNQDIINIANSNWDYDGDKLLIDRLSVPFNLNTLFATIPTTEINLGDTATAYMSGDISLENLSTKLDIDIVKFKNSAIELAQSTAFFNLSYADDKLSISSKKSIKFNIGTLKCTADSPEIELNKNTLTLNASKLAIDDFFVYQRSLNNSIKNIKFNIDSIDNQTKIYTPDLDISTVLTKDKWDITFNSLSKLKQYSPFLQKYKIYNGKISLFQNQNNDDINLLAKIDYPYNILNINNKLISKYILKGKIYEDKIDININDKIDLSISENISVIGKNIGINLDSVFALLKDLKTTPTEDIKKNISMKFKDSFIYLSDKRRAIADEINLQHYNNITTAQLIHNKGKAGFKLENDLFHIYGEGFDSKFMENLFALSKFKKGSFDFSIKGDLEQYSGILFIKDTTVIEYKLLNNILAFVNTIPSLVTFSLPGYNKNGLMINSAYINFKYKDEEYKLDGIYLDSKEMDIIGRGTSSFKNNSINLELNLKTDLGSTASKIPLVGYILLGEDTISTTLKITGKLDDPKVKSMIAKDIVVAPLNIIKRTLFLPFYLFGSKEEK